LEISPLWSSLDGRLLVAELTHRHHLFDPITIYVVYAPADRSLRPPFYAELATMICNDQHLPHRSIMLGDYNYNIHIPGHLRVQWLSLSWFDPLKSDATAFNSYTYKGPLGTSKRDFILLSGDLLPAAAQPTVTHVSNHTDHKAVSIGLKLFAPPTGPGIWR
ncbi:hypothetical protein BDB00DRAFT_751168, partial [Zychaea mexicana]|uniref:uncharacterized protein n=1 Tax=Zychaea mexicana TaxID=64656 RepID=UPI0022FE1706